MEDKVTESMICNLMLNIMHASLPSSHMYALVHLGIMIQLPQLMESNES